MPLDSSPENAIERAKRLAPPSHDFVNAESATDLAPIAIPPTLPKIFIASINASYFKPLDLRHRCLLRQILHCWQAIALDSLEQTSNRYLKEKEPSRRIQ